MTMDGEEGHNFLGGMHSIACTSGSLAREKKNYFQRFAGSGTDKLWDKFLLSSFWASVYRTDGALSHSSIWLDWKTAIC